MPANAGIQAALPEFRFPGDSGFPLSRAWRLDILRPTGAEESGVRGDLGPKLTFRWQKVNETCDSSSTVQIAPGWRDLQGEVGPASRAGPLQECPISSPAFAGMS